MSKFGEVIKACRLAEGLTLEALARKVGTHKGYISGIENERVNPPSVKLLTKLAKTFARHGILVEDLVELAYVGKAPGVIRERLLGKIAGNPLLTMKLRAVPVKEAV